MLAAISPATYNYEETLNTLQYADRAKAIQLKVRCPLLATPYCTPKHIPDHTPNQARKNESVTLTPYPPTPTPNPGA